MTEKELRKKVVSIMQSWLGYNETTENYKRIIDIYKSHEPLARGYAVRYTDEWCATAVSAAFIQAGLTDIAPTECSCSRMIELYKKLGRWKEVDEYVPQIGDVVIYDIEGPDQVGIVVALHGTSMIIIEGNKEETVAYRAMTVNGTYIRGYCLPDYAGKANKIETKPVPIKRGYAKSFDRVYAKTYIVTASALNMRSGAGTDRPVIKSLPNGTKVTCYGYYTKNESTVWLYVKDQDGIFGYCSKKYLK